MGRADHKDEDIVILGITVQVGNPENTPVSLNSLQCKQIVVRSFSVWPVLQVFSGFFPIWGSHLLLAQSLLGMHPISQILLPPFTTEEEPLVTVMTQLRLPSTFIIPFSPISTIISKRPLHKLLQTSFAKCRISWLRLQSVRGLPLPLPKMLPPL